MKTFNSPKTILAWLSRLTLTAVVALFVASSVAFAQGDQSDPPCGPFSGLYRTTYGMLRLTRTGNRVRGVYTTRSRNDSSLSGTVRGNVLTGTWVEPDSRGRFRFTLGRDGRSFTGSFTSGEESGGQSSAWNGTCETPIGRETQERITFPPGESSTTLRGQVSVRNSMVYQLRARAGQRMSVRLNWDYPRVRADLRFRIYLPNDSDEVVQGGFDVAEWEGLLPATGDYRIVVHANNTSRVVNYTLEVTVR